MKRARRTAVAAAVVVAATTAPTAAAAAIGLDPANGAKRGLGANVVGEPSSSSSSSSSLRHRRMALSTTTMTTTEGDDVRRGGGGIRLRTTTAAAAAGVERPSSLSAVVPHEEEEWMHHRGLGWVGDFVDKYFRPGKGGGGEDDDDGGGGGGDGDGDGGGGGGGGGGGDGGGGGGGGGRPPGWGGGGGGGDNPPRIPVPPPPPTPRPTRKREAKAPKTPPPTKIQPIPLTPPPTPKATTDAPTTNAPTTNAPTRSPFQLMTAPGPDVSTYHPTSWMPTDLPTTWMPTNLPTSAPTTSSPTPKPECGDIVGESCWYPHEDVDSGDRLCKNDADYPSDYADAINRGGFLFHTEDECCATYPEACAECGTYDGEGCWYPAIIDEDSADSTDDQTKDCVFGSDYPEYDDDSGSFRRNFLFTSEARCCVHFPLACPDNDVELEEYWFPDMDNVDSSNADGGTIECIHGNTYPDYMTDPAVAPNHLFDTETECCDRYPCGDDLEEYWYPEVDVVAGAIVCVYGREYPLFMLDRPDGHLFDDEVDCVDEWEIPSPTAVPTQMPSNTPMWFPKLHDDGSKTCEYSSEYPEMYDASDAHEDIYLFDSEDECCAAYPEACDEQPTPPAAMWYPDLEAAVPGPGGGSDGSIIDCRYDSDYPDFMLIVASHLFDTEEACCMAYPCSSNDSGLGEYWYPMIDDDVMSIDCMFGNDYPDYMIDDLGEHLFDSEEECEEKWERDDTTTTAATTTTVGCGGPGDEGQECWYPHVDPDTDERTCAYDADYPADYVTDNTPNLFGSRAECCDHYPDACPATTTTAATTTSSSVGCGGSGEECWYPHLVGPDTDDRACVLDADYPPGYLTDSQSLGAIFLFTSKAECCHHYPTACPSTGDKTMAMWYPDIEDAVPDPGGADDVGVINCVYGTSYPDFYLMPDIADDHLFFTRNACCEVHPCDSNKLDYWYPRVDIEQQTIVCVHDNNYPMYMLESPAGNLFETEEDCSDEYAMPETTSTTTTTTTTTVNMAPPGPDNSTEVPYMWHPELGGEDNICVYGNDYEGFVSMLLPEHWDTYLFDTLEGCCEAHDCSDMPDLSTLPTTTTTTTTSTTTTTTLLPENPSGPDDIPDYWHPDLSGNGNQCVYGKDYYDFVSLLQTQFQSMYVFHTLSECCDEHDCSDMTTTTTAASTTTTTATTTTEGETTTTAASTTSSTTTEETTTTAATTTTTTTAMVTLIPEDPTSPDDIPEYWHPNVTGDDNECVHGKDYYDFVSRLRPQYHPMYLFDTPSDCCEVHDCSDMTLGSNGKYVFAYPDLMNGMEECVVDDAYPTFFLRGSNPETYLFKVLEECCAAHGYACGDGGTDLSPPAPETGAPTDMPTDMPTDVPTDMPTDAPTNMPTTDFPTHFPTDDPTMSPTMHRYWYSDISADGNACIYGSEYPSWMLTYANTELFATQGACCLAHGCDDGGTTTDGGDLAPPAPETDEPTSMPTDEPTSIPTDDPTSMPMDVPTKMPTDEPTSIPTDDPTSMPTDVPTEMPTPIPTDEPTSMPTDVPTEMPTPIPTDDPTSMPTDVPTDVPTQMPNIPSYWYSDISADGNACIYGTEYPPWMVRYADSELFETQVACCQEHGCDPENSTPDDAPPVSAVVTFLDEDFEEGDPMAALPWIHGGTHSHVANWHLTTNRGISGIHSLRSGDLNHMGGASSDISLKVTSPSGATVKFQYTASVSYPYDYFHFTVDGEADLSVNSPSGDEWMTYELDIPAGEHTLGWHVAAASDEWPDVGERAPQWFGTGIVYVDDLEFVPKDR